MKKYRMFYCRWCGHDGALKGKGRIKKCSACGRENGIMHVGMSHDYLKANIQEIKSTGLQIHCMVNTFFKKVGY